MAQEDQAVANLLNYDELKEMYRDAVQRGCPEDLAVDYVAEAAQVMLLVVEDASISAQAHKELVEGLVTQRLKG